MGTSSCSLFCGPKISLCSYDTIPFHCLSLERAGILEKSIPFLQSWSLPIDLLWNPYLDASILKSVEIRRVHSGTNFSFHPYSLTCVTNSEMEPFELSQQFSMLKVLRLSWFGLYWALICSAGGKSNRLVMWTFNRRCLSMDQVCLRKQTLK